MARRLFVARSGIKRGCLLIGLCLLVRAARAAETGSETEELTQRMRTVAVRVEGLSRDLKVMRLNQRATLRSLEEIERALRLVYQRREVLRVERVRHKDALMRATAEEANAAEGLVLLADEVRQRLRALYMARKGGAEDVLVFHAGDRQAPLFSPRELVLWRRVLTADRELIDQLERKREEVAHHRERLDRERVTLESLEGSIESQAVELRKKQDERSRVLRRHQATEDQITQSLKGLRREWSRLEGVLRQLTGGTSTGGEQVPGGISFPPLHAPGTMQTRPELTGGGALLAIPVIGRVVQPFGKRRVQEFDDFVASNGVELLVEVGGEVKAVREGVVRFVGEMPGFGPVVVVDHGERLYSLYGRLRDVVVSEGVKLGQGERIGVVGPPGERVGNFYFECRQAGRPIDPIAQLGVPWG